MSKTGCIIDGGANIGNHTIYFSKVFNRSVVAVEPADKNFKYLKQNVEDNDLDHIVHLKNKALSCNNSRYEASYSEGNSGQTKMIQSSDGNIESISIDRIVFNNECFAYNSVAAIKLDIEGMEKNAIRGVQCTIKKHKPLLLVEDKSDIVKTIMSWFPDCNYKVIKPLQESPTYVLYTNSLPRLLWPCLSVWNRFVD
jgi:FkbM family methyltransferase